jgi:hypothetical protein
MRLLRKEIRIVPATPRPNVVAGQNSVNRRNVSYEPCSESWLVTQGERRDRLRDPRTDTR